MIYNHEDAKGTKMNKLWGEEQFMEDFMAGHPELEGLSGAAFNRLLLESFEPRNIRKGAEMKDEFYVTNFAADDHRHVFYDVENWATGSFCRMRFEPGEARREEIHKSMRALSVELNHLNPKS